MRYTLAFRHWPREAEDLLSSCIPGEADTLHKLADVMELCDVSEVDKSLNLWEYLVSQGFSVDFVERVAKKFWRVSRLIYRNIPFSEVITGSAWDGERRLMVHLLREMRERVCFPEKFSCEDAP